MQRQGSIAGIACAAVLAVGLAVVSGGCAAASGAFDRAVAGMTGDEGGTPGAAFSDGDRAAIRAYFAARSDGRAAGTGHDPKGASDAPPLQKNVPLPPGLARHPLPAELEDRLSPLPDGYVRFQVGTETVLVDARTEVVLDLDPD